MNVSKIEAWFKDRCDGDWEHQGGITIETTDNPGWYILIEFDDLKHGVDSTIKERNILRSDSDFIMFNYQKEAQSLEISCGVNNLSEALEIFLGLED
ncbi:Immunity protein 53 [Cohaesibacter marisflavi]|uniref:Immunity protein 53 n=1 Tax=Cohaesibacter marisflavi TaxID=655353 RepID=A0A1I5NPH9_9HYPH|nr:Imm53 family immunity protein [Cohaesibacter marisflavi]SFP23713.1 Immunity protein 53 [Cohaesibacter marisflavi]